MPQTSLKIVFHGQNASNFRQGFDALVGPGHHIIDLSDSLALPGEREHYETADVIVGIKVRVGRHASGDQGVAPLNIALQVAEETAGNRVVSILEGGYDLRALAASAREHVRALMGM